MGDVLGRDEAYSDELATLLDDRAATYALLARLLASEVDADLLSGLVGMAFPEDTGNPALDEGSRLMNGYLRQAASRQAASRPDDDVVTELAVDFCRLFVVRRRNEKDAAYPFESVYTSTEHTTMAGARDDVRAIYRAAGLEKDEDLHIGDDHIALELEYMAEVARQAAAAVRDGETFDGQLALQATFLDSHLLNWVPRFSDAMVRHARTDFYRGLARFLIGYLEDDRALLGELAAGETA